MQQAAGAPQLHLGAGSGVKAYHRAIAAHIGQHESTVHPLDQHVLARDALVAHHQIVAVGATDANLGGVGLKHLAVIEPAQAQQGQGTLMHRGLKVGQGSWAGQLVGADASVPENLIHRACMRQARNPHQAQGAPAHVRPGQHAHAGWR